MESKDESLNIPSLFKKQESISKYKAWPYAMRPGSAVWFPREERHRVGQAVPPPDTSLYSCVILSTEAFKDDFH